MLGPGAANLTTDTHTELRLMDADPPGTAPSACPSRPTALTQLSPAPAPLHAPQQEVGVTETPTQSNASRMYQSVTNYLNRAFAQAPAVALTASLPNKQVLLCRGHPHATSTLLQEPATSPARLV